ncbi:MAG TPA: DNA methyltransferase [Kiritimatiellia bacterium]|nr:DNA methyltransferase [Kiritimatiellia bacterium]
MKRAIEDSFPIVEINRLAVPERNSFKPIYQMHKWFARRASCVFRAILLGALKPLPVDKDGKPTKSGAQVIMDEFYKDHTHDPDTNGKVVLDPFMGGGTTVVEALRLGCKVIGIDLNPVAWFIVKTEIEPVDLDELRAAFDRLAERKVEWSGKPLRETLLDLYKTKCPCCGGEADSIYTFWVKSAICTDQNCKKQVPLFGDYIVAQKTPSIRHFPDCDCPQCGKVFDWEIEPAAMVGDPKLLVNAGKFSAGQGRTSARWAYGRREKAEATCPWCQKSVKPRPSSSKPKRKKVELTVLLCPKCESVWQFRGPLDEKVQCPCCRHEYDPRQGNVPDKGAYLCACGNQGKIIESIRSLPEDQLLPMRPYAIQGYCPACDGPSAEDEESDGNGELFDKDDESTCKQKANAATGTNPNSILWKNNGKFFQRLDNDDLSRYQAACELWDTHRGALPHPKSKIPPGQETQRLIEHHYFHWHQMFNPRQLLALSTIVHAATAESDVSLQESLLSAFTLALNNNNSFSRFHRFTHREGKVEGVFARHDFQPKMTVCEANCWGVPAAGYGSFVHSIENIIEGKQFAARAFDWRGSEKVEGDPIAGTGALSCQSSASNIPKTRAELVVTDPPYAGNVNYAELADFFFVWLRLALATRYPHFAPEITPKAEEVVENRSRGKSAQDFEAGLTAVFSQCRAVLDPAGLLAFTFHHAEGSAWESLLQAICNAGFQIDSVIPIHGESESSLHLLDKEGAISYDLIHVCSSRLEDTKQRSWAGVRQEIRQRAREEVKMIEGGRYGQEPLAPTDRNIILIGKCLELYSEHYGKIVDHEDKPVPLHAALEEIRMMVDQLTTTESALPPELEDIDAPSYVYLTCLCDRKEIKSDEVHKATRGITEPSTLMERDLMIKGRAKRGRSYEVKSPLERLDLLKKKFGAGSASLQTTLFDEDLTQVVTPGVVFIDYVHFLIGLAENGESVMEWLEKFRGKRPQIRAALDYLARRNRNFSEPVRKILGLMDERTLFTEKKKADESSA